MHDTNKPEVIFLVGEDWANVSYNFMTALKKVGVNALALSKRPITWYDNQAQIYFKPEVEVYPLCLNAKWIIWMHSVFTPLPDQIVNNRAIKFGVFHGGTAYRHGFEQANNIFNPRVDLSIIQTLELWNLGAKDPKVQLIPPVDTEKIRPDSFYDGERKLKIAHFPRHPGVKGSATINKVLADLRGKHEFEYLYSEDIVSWEENLERIKACDVYVEQFGTGYWSVTAMEAAALGKIVIAPFEHEELYKEQHGLADHGITVANSEEQLRDSLVDILELKEEVINERQREARNWVDLIHGYEATGNRIKKLLNL